MFLKIVKIIRKVNGIDVSVMFLGLVLDDFDFGLRIIVELLVFCIFCFFCC